MQEQGATKTFDFWHDNKNQKIKEFLTDSSFRVKQAKGGRTLSNVLSQQESGKPTVSKFMISTSRSFLPGESSLPRPLEERRIQDRKDYSTTLREKLSSHGAELENDEIRQIIKKSSSIHLQLFSLEQADKPVIETWSKNGSLPKAALRPSELEIQTQSYQKYADVTNAEMKTFLANCHAASLRKLTKTIREEQVEEVQRIRMEACFLNLTKHNKNRGSVQQLLKQKKKTMIPELVWRGTGYTPKAKLINSYLLRQKEEENVKKKAPSEDKVAYTQSPRTKPIFEPSQEIFTQKTEIPGSSYRKTLAQAKMKVLRLPAVLEYNNKSSGLSTFVSTNTHRVGKHSIKALLSSDIGSSVPLLSLSHFPLSSQMENSQTELISKLLSRKISHESLTQTRTRQGPNLFSRVVQPEV